jgi:hypothetical protein
MNDDLYAVLEGQGKAAQDTPAPETAQTGPRNMSTEEYAAFKKAEREQLFERVEHASERVAKDPSALRGLLDLMARLPRYSAHNALLIYDQMPEATRLATTEVWNREGARVNRGEHGIAILEPGDEYTRDDGTIGTYYNVRRVFDESQTTARHIEPRHPGMRDALFALVEASPVAIDTTAALPDGQGHAIYDDASKTITVAKGLDEAELFSVLATEISHVELAKQDGFYDRATNEPTAELCAHVIAARYGVDKGTATPALDLDGSDLSGQDVRGELSRIRDAAKAVSGRMDKTLETIRSRSQGQKHSERGGRDER